MPLAASRAAMTPARALLPAWKGLIMEPKLATRPPACEAAMASAVALRSPSSPRSLAQRGRRGQRAVDAGGMPAALVQVAFLAQRELRPDLEADDVGGDHVLPARSERFAFGEEGRDEDRAAVAAGIVVIERVGGGAVDPRGEWSRGAARGEEDRSFRLLAAVEHGARDDLRPPAPRCRPSSRRRSRRSRASPRRSPPPAGRVGGARDEIAQFTRQSHRRSLRPSRRWRPRRGPSRAATCRLPPSLTEPGSGWPTISSARLRGLDQLVEVDAGLDAHLLAHEHQVLGADVAGRALVRRRTGSRRGRRREESNWCTPISSPA